MTITVSFIRRRAGGRVTVRPKSYDKRELTIGRATDCDVFLPDLRIGLHHARFVVLGANRALLEAEGDRRLRIDRASVRRREIHFDEKTDIRIGPYQVLVEGGAAPGDVSISIELIEPATAPADPHGEEAVFSLKKGAAPAKRPSAWILTLLVAGLFLVFPIIIILGHPPPPRPVALTKAPAHAKFGGYEPDRPWLSGPMSSGHANLVHECRDCHQTPFVRVRDEVCLDCHEDTFNHAEPDKLALSRAAPHGGRRLLRDLHGALGIPEGRCGSCHFEHNGPEGVIRTDDRLCTDCHADMSKRIADTDFLDVASSQAHPEFRPTIVVTPGKTAPLIERLSLDSKLQQDTGLKFPHDFHLKSDDVLRKLRALPRSERNGLGEDMNCQGCHKLDAARAMFEPVEMERDCSMCHSLVFEVSSDGEKRALPHGKPKEVERILEDYYIAQASTAGAPENTLDETLSAEARQRRARLREEAFARARTTAARMIAQIFSKDGICEKCHMVKAPAAGEDRAAYDIEPVSLVWRFMPEARFVHAPHMTGNVDCEDCH
ncbi:MAG TPA: cytochrome c3 family protein, partial [Parvularculaceae bacterium]|nr:cytochrome c3 family protein [Parvularculaceae bacterium]